MRYDRGGLSVLVAVAGTGSWYCIVCWQMVRLAAGVVMCSILELFVGNGGNDGW